MIRFGVSFGQGKRAALFRHRAASPCREAAAFLQCRNPAAYVAARNAGAAVLLISEDLDEVRELSDRIAMSGGRISYEAAVADVAWQRSARRWRPAPNMAIMLLV